MPWISVLLPRAPRRTGLAAGAGAGDAITGDADPNGEGARHLAAELAGAVAAALGLADADVVVLVQVADAASGDGAVVSVAGRRRDAADEQAAADAARRVVARYAGLGEELVVVVRTPP